MKNLRINRFWQIALPVLTYYLMYHCIHYLCLLLLGQWMGTLSCLGLSSAVTLIFMFSVYRGLPIVRKREVFDKKMLAEECVAVLGIVVLGMILNVIISNTPLVEVSEGYRQANSTLFSGTMPSRIIVNGILIPMLEEVVYRGIVCGQLDLWYGKKISVFISALLFGMMHFNMVQFLYAFLMGIALGYVFVRYKKLWVPAAAHGLTNLVVIFITAFL